jgi:hypothetical protein
MRFILLRTTALLVLGLAATGNAADCPPGVCYETNVSQEDLAKIPTARDPWAILQAMPGVQLDRLVVGYDELGLFDDFEKLRTTLLEVEGKTLCEEVRRAGWNNLTLEHALRAASSQEEALVKADAAGLLRGFVALLLDGKGCAEPPAEVLNEVGEYSRRFGLPSSDKLPWR